MCVDAVHTCRQQPQRSADDLETPLFGGAANLNGEVGALLPRLCVRKAELSVAGLGQHGLLSRGVPVA